VQRPSRPTDALLRRVAEVCQDREDGLLAVDGVLDVLPLADVDDLLATLGLDLGGALDDLLNGRLAKCPLLVPQWAFQVVGLLCLCCGRVPVGRCVSGLGRDLQGSDGEVTFT